jgi:DMSO/TMAO reductase YedYZ molybdopterin-dependent catalytic subunit
MKLFKLFICFVFASLFLEAQQDGNGSFLKISGEIPKPVTIYRKDLAGMKHITRTLNVHGKEQQYTGVPVQELLTLAGVATGKQLRGANLSKYLLVKSSDGYKVIFSLVELDSSFTDRQAFLADSMEGKPLPDSVGPFRLVVPGEKKPVRSAYKVTEFVLGSYKE